MRCSRRHAPGPSPIATGESPGEAALVRESLGQRGFVYRHRGRKQRPCLFESPVGQPAVRRPAGDLAKCSPCESDREIAGGRPLRDRTFPTEARVKQRLRVSHLSRSEPAAKDEPGQSPFSVRARHVSEKGPRDKNGVQRAGLVRPWRQCRSQGTTAGGARPDPTSRRRSGRLRYGNRLIV